MNNITSLPHCILTVMFHHNTHPNRHTEGGVIPETMNSALVLYMINNFFFKYEIRTLEHRNATGSSFLCFTVPTVKDQLLLS